MKRFEIRSEISEVIKGRDPITLAPAIGSIAVERRILKTNVMINHDIDSAANRMPFVYLG